MKQEYMLNFNAGPAALPDTVLQQAAEAVLNYNNTGLSILSIPHRGDLFLAILEESKALVKELCGLGDDYELMWLQGGGRMQFCMVPMNFLGAGETAGYIDSGHWSAEAIDAATYYGHTEVLGSSRSDHYTHLPEWPAPAGKNLAYLHFTTNNTIYGTQWPEIPESDVPLIADMSSDIFSIKRDYTNCAMFYAVAQKNLGAAGNTLVAIRKDFLEHVRPGLPPMMDYKVHAEKNSLLNTPPVFGIYVSLLMLRWIKAKGIDAIEQENRAKAALLYAEIERNPLFHTVVDENSRSLMNVVFHGRSKEMEKQFLECCIGRGVTGIEGHRSVGAFRASLYNGMPLAGVEKLVSIMHEFAESGG